MSAPVKAVLAAVGLTILLTLGAAATDSAFTEAGNTSTIQNESFTPTEGLVELNESNKTNTQYHDDVVVQNTTKTTTFQEQGNYTWNKEGNGTIIVIQNSNLSNLSTATINYTFTQQDSNASFLALELTTSASEWTRFLPLILIVGLAIGALRILGGA